MDLTLSVMSLHHLKIDPSLGIEGSLGGGTGVPPCVGDGMTWMGLT